MTHLWRISIFCDLKGMGGEFSKGRWHTGAAGKRMVYSSEHPALALVETLVNMRGSPDRIPSIFQLLKIAVPDGVSVQRVDRASLRDGWESEQEITQRMGDAWLASAATALLSVPSAPSPESTNYLLNPLHPDARKITVEWCRWITYDNRLFAFRENS